MKRIFMAVVLLLVVTGLFAQEAWPRLNDEIWEGMTVEQLEGYLQNNDIDARDEETGFPAAIWAARDSNPEIVQHFLDIGISVNEDLLKGNTMIMIAQINKNPAVFQLLLDKGADLHVRDFEGYTILMLACEFNLSLEYISFFIDQGLDVNARTLYGMTPLMYSSWRSTSPEVIQLLIDKGANIDAESKKGSTALMLASKYNDSSIVEVLLTVSENQSVNWEKVWELTQKNEKLTNTKSYWRINELQYDAQSNSMLYNNPGLLKETTKNFMKEYNKYYQ